MSLQEIVVMIHDGEYSRAIASLEFEVKDESMPPQTRVECCRWLAECNHRLEDYREAGDWYMEAVRIILRTDADDRSKARQALALCNKALEANVEEGYAADVLVAARVSQYLVGLYRQQP